jgi:putative addiction module CopG family antidote
MTVNLTPEQERFIQEELQSGHFRTAEEVIANALLALREKEILSNAVGNGQRDEGVRDMLNFAEKNRTVLKDISVKELIPDGHRL